VRARSCRCTENIHSIREQKRNSVYISVMYNSAKSGHSYIVIRCGAGRDVQVVAVFGTCRRLGNLRYHALREALLSSLK
jgi:hypothetical protein